MMRCAFLVNGRLDQQCSLRPNHPGPHVPEAAADDPRSVAGEDRVDPRVLAYIDEQLAISRAHIIRWILADDEQQSDHQSLS